MLLHPLCLCPQNYFHSLYSFMTSANVSKNFRVIIPYYFLLDILSCWWSTFASFAYGSGVGALDSGHGAINEPVGDGWFSRAWQEASYGGDRFGMHIGRANKIIGGVVIVMRGVFYDVV